MKRLIAVLVAFFLVVVFLMSSALAEGWKPTAEVSVAVHNAYVDELSGASSYKKTSSTQSIMVGIEKGETGFYAQGENFSPSEKEPRSTNGYVGFYTNVFGTKLDAGYAFYCTREKGELDYHAVYASVDFPAPIWQVVPFVKTEYRLAKKFEGQEMSGFLYYGGLKREFQIHERVNLTAEVSVGGNTGIYGLPAENLAFAREKVEVSFSLTEQLKLKISGLTQQNLGKRDGIAADTDRLFASAVIVWTF